MPYYVGFFPQQDQYPLLRGDPEQWCADLAHETRAGEKSRPGASIAITISFNVNLSALFFHVHTCPAAAEAFLGGDWACITRLGLMLLNSAFLASDPEQFPPEDPSLQRLYQPLKLLVKIASNAFSETGT